MLWNCDGDTSLFYPIWINTPLKTSEHNWRRQICDIYPQHKENGDFIGGVSCPAHLGEFFATAEVVTSMNLIPRTFRHVGMVFMRYFLPLPPGASRKKQRGWLRSSVLLAWWNWSSAFGEMSTSHGTGSRVSQVKPDWTAPSIVLSIYFDSSLGFGNATWRSFRAAASCSAHIASILL